MSNNKLFEYYDGQILCHHSRDENSQSVHFYLHAHEHMELFYFISGNVEYVVEGNIYKLSPGDIVLARSAEVHRPVIYPGVPYERISIQFSDAVIKSIDSSGVLLKPFLDRSLGCQNLYTLADRNECGLLTYFDGFDKPEKPYAKRINIISVLLRCLLDIALQFEDISQAERYPSNDNITGELIEYINNELFNKISVLSVSQHFFLSESQINRIFKKATGSTIWDYIRTKRLLAAREKILAGQSATEAAASCGFQDYSAFYRAYVARFHIAPSNTHQPNLSIEPRKMIE